MNHYNEDKHKVLPNLDELSSVSKTDEDPLSSSTPTHTCDNFNENMSDDDDDTGQYQLLSSISMIKTEEDSLDRSIELPFDPKEWLIYDSSSGKLRPPRQNEFLSRILDDSRYSSYLSWLDRNEGLFKIHQPEQVARLWTKVKNRHTIGIMDYNTFARGIRCYYKTGSMIKTHKSIRSGLNYLQTIHSKEQTIFSDESC